MKKRRLRLLLLCAASWVAITASILAQVSSSALPYYVEMDVAGAPGLYDLIVPSHVMDKSRDDLADLRIHDANGREIPYALRIRREIDNTRPIAATIFNRASVGGAHEVTVDLGAYDGEHNAVEVVTSGSNFRRRVVVEGSNSLSEWRTLKTGEIIFRFNAQNQLVDSNRVNYPSSRFRYLRIRVLPDEPSDVEDRPFISDVRVLMAVREQGELVYWSVSVPPVQLMRNQGAPASSWAIDLGARVPVDRLSLDFADESFSRPFQLEAIDDQNVRLVAAGELTRRSGDDKPITINFNEEEHTRNLRLVVTDHSNPTLSLLSIQGGAPARQLVFELKEPVNQPVRLYFGNQKVSPPHYDFEKDLATKLSTKPTRISVGSTVQNPNYTPEPKPFTERVPWLIYLVLAASGIALSWILINLARRSRRVKPSDEQQISQTNADQS